MHEYGMVFGFALTLTGIFAGILMNRSDVRDLRQEINALRHDTRTELNDVRASISSLRIEMQGEFREFYRSLGQHDARLDKIEEEGKKS